MKKLLEDYAKLYGLIKFNCILRKKVILLLYLQLLKLAIQCSGKLTLS